MDVLVTGGAGFIGANLVRRLVADERFGAVTVLDDLSTGARANLEGLDVRFVEGTILDVDVLYPLIDAVDSVVHLAARPSVPRSIAEPLASHAANATGTLHVLEAARRAGGALRALRQAGHRHHHRRRAPRAAVAGVVGDMGGGRGGPRIPGFLL